MTLDPNATPDARLAAVRQRVHDMNKDDLPILVGPFYSELGFEAIYWTPFVAWLKAKVTGFDSRAVIVTRGGAACLYTHLAKRQADIYALRSVTDVRRASLKQQLRTKVQKQTELTSFDHTVIADAARAHGLTLPYHVVHPSLMYWAFTPYWNDTAGLRHLQAMTDYALLPKPIAPAGVALPPKFVAVKFYGRATFPYPHPDVAEFVKTIVATIAAQTPVILLRSADAYDDHSDIPISGDNVLAVGGQVGPAENLYVQAAVLAKATAFVGTYGGMAQVALRMGVPSASFYTEFGGTSHAHFALNSLLSKVTNVPFLVGSLSDVGLWSQLTSVPTVSVPGAPVPKAEEVLRASGA